LLAVVEPGMRSVQTATRAARLAADIGIQRTLVVVNKIRAEHEVETLRQALGNLAILGALPYSAALARADLEGQSADVDDSVFRGAVERLSKTVEEHLAR
jgi:CO dehydrogenase maturation factor